MDCNNSKGNEKRTRRRKTSFTEALKEKYCVDDEPTFDFIIVSPKRKTNSSAELAHLQTVVLNDMDITRADIPRQGLDSLCPNVVDLDLANNLLETWSELLPILSQLPKVRYLNVSRNKLHLDLTNNDSFLNVKLYVENLALNDTGTSIEDVVRLSQIMPTLKELHLCDNNYENLGNIECKIHDGAFSCLECLRLNNNEITRWSEVWKLRHLPHLKCLVLSGNPISCVFYQNEDRTDNDNKDAADLCQRAGHCGETEISQKSSVSGKSEAETSVADEKSLQFDITDSNMDMNNDCCGILIDNFYEESNEVTEEVFDSGDNNDNDRPVNRFGFHVESDSSSGISSDQDHVVGSDFDDLISSSSDSRFALHTGITHSNINSNCPVNARKRLCDDCHDGMHDDFLLGDDAVDMGNMDDVHNEVDDWHRAVAEEFLHEIIDGISFDDMADQTVPQFQPSDYEETSITSYNVETVDDSSNPESVSNVGVAFSVDNSTTMQSAAAENTAEDVNVCDNNSLSIVQERGFQLGYSSPSSDIDAQFIPRAVRLLDDEAMSSFFYMVTPSPPRCRAQRCLFQEPHDTGRKNSDELEDASYRDSNHQSTSDSCSDCEAEQHKKQTAGGGVDATNMTSPADFTSTTGRTSPSHSCLETSSSTSCSNTLSESTASVSSDSCSQSGILSPNSMKDCTKLKDTISPCKLCQVEQNLESNNNNNVSEQSGNDHRFDHGNHQTGSDPVPVPFQHLQMLCLSSANLHHWSHLKAFTAFPKLTNLRLKNNPLYSNVNPDDRRKLYVASLPKVNVLNGSEVSHTEREKAERHYLRYFMDKEEKPDFYHTLVKKHGPPVKLVDIDLSAGYQEWANLKFLCKGVEEFSRKVHLVQPVGRLRILISQILKLPKRCFIMYHHSCGPSHPESEQELVELRCEALPMSRFDFADGDEIHIDVQD